MTYCSNRNESSMDATPMKRKDSRKGVLETVIGRHTIQIAVIHSSRYGSHFTAQELHSDSVFGPEAPYSEAGLRSIKRKVKEQYDNCGLTRVTWRQI